MDLLGTLSNPEIGASLQRLCCRLADVPAESAPAQWREDRRRRYGSIDKAVDAVLAESAQPLDAAEIHARVERLLRGPVARSSVRSRLAVRARTEPPRYERVSRGRYRRHA